MIAPPIWSTVERSADRHRRAMAIPGTTGAVKVAWHVFG
jgi:hypothetical protein